MTDIVADAEAPADLWMVMAIIQPFKLDSVTLAVEALPWLNGMTVTKCTGLRNPGSSGELTGGGAAFGARPAGNSDDRASTDIEHDSFGDFAQRVKVEIAVSSRLQADEVARVIANAARTGRSGDGKVFLYPLGFARQIRTLGTQD